MGLQIKKTLEKVYCITRFYKYKIDFDKIFFHQSYFLRRKFNGIGGLGKNEEFFPKIKKLRIGLLYSVPQKVLACTTCVFNLLMSCVH